MTMRTLPISRIGHSFSVAILVAIVTFISLPVRAETPSPEQVIRSFYYYYVQEIVSRRDPFEGDRTELKRFATDRLLREIDGMRKGPDGLDGDYFVDAQDVDKEWKLNINISPPEIRGDKATANVELRGHKVGNRKLRVALARQKDAWKIDKVTGVE